MGMVRGFRNQEYNDAVPPYVEHYDGVHVWNSILNHGTWLEKQTLLDTMAEEGYTPGPNEIGPPPPFWSLDNQPWSWNFDPSWSWRPAIGDSPLNTRNGFREFVRYLDYTMTSLGTFVDAQGQTVYNAHNGIGWSEDLTNWTADNTTWDQATNTLTVTDVDNPRIYPLVTPTGLAPGDAAILYAEVEAGTNDKVRIEHYNNGVGSWEHVAAGIASGPGSIDSQINGTVNVVGLVAGQRTIIWVEGKVPAGGSQDNPAIKPIGAAVNDTIKIYKMWWHRSDLPMAPNPLTGDSYVKTEDAAVYMPRGVHHEWIDGVLTPVGVRWESKEDRTNAVDFPNNMDTGQWAATRSSIAEEAGEETPTGQSAWRLTDDTTSTTTHLLRNTSVAYGVSEQAAFSVYCKAGTLNWVQLRMFDGANTFAQVNFDLVNGAVGTETNGTGAISYAGNGWWRCSVMGNGASGVAGSFCQVNLTDTDANNGSYTGDGNGSILLHMAQSELGDMPSSLIPYSGTRTAESGAYPPEYLQEVFGNGTDMPSSLGPELVQNGDFNEVGPELSQFVGPHDMAGTNLNSMLADEMPDAAWFFYGLDFTSGPGSVKPTLKKSSTYGFVGKTAVANVSYTDTLTSAVNEIQVQSIGDTTGTIMNAISVKQLDPNSRWTFGDGWSLAPHEGGFKAVCDGSQSAPTNLVQNSILTVGKTYECTVIVDTLTASTLRLYAGLSGGGDYLSQGTNVVRVTAATNGNLYVQGTDSTVGSVTLVSVKEVIQHVSIATSGLMNYADNGNVEEAQFSDWVTGGDRIFNRLRTDSSRTGAVQFLQREPTTLEVGVISAATTAYAPGLNVPFSIASRHTSQDINGAHEGTVLTANTTPTQLPQLMTVPFQIAPTFMGSLGTVQIYSYALPDYRLSYETGGTI